MYPEKYVRSYSLRSMRMNFRSKPPRNFIPCAGTKFKVFTFSLLIALTSLFHYVEEDIDYLGQSLSADYEFKKPLQNKRRKSPLKSKASLESRDLEYVVTRKRVSFNQKLNLFVQTTVKFLHEPVERQESFFSYEEIAHFIDYLRPVLSRSPPLPS